ncbi:MAG: S-methyl-5'-thioadenosine phosphorylase [Deltaproteobacteria bacterium]|nr:MAG: S-methyl-5'-thioadenosine phosphorylase [Deltaproteobacteria bacterium]
MSVLGIIGGSGLYDLPGLTGVRRQRMTTPFGDPSDEIVTGLLGEQEIAFVSRHGAGHRFSPTEVPYRANLHALKQLGVTRVISVSAVGSMKEEIAPGHMVLPAQYIDRTVARPRTFFDDGIVAHVAFADPVCPQLNEHMKGACFAAGATAHAGGTYLCIDGMTALPEAKLAREAELCYATLALATDYDCWYAGHESVTVAQVIETMRRNVTMAREVIRNAALGLSRLRDGACNCAHALDSAVMTAPQQISKAARERLALLLGDRFR